MDRATIGVYEAEGAHYAERRGVQRPERAEAFAAALRSGGRRLDLGAGPGHYLPLLGRPAVAVDAAHAMARAAADAAPDVAAVRADLVRLPFDRHAFAGIWASKAHQHLPSTELPMALGDAHRVLEVGGRLELTLFAAPTGTATIEEVTDAASGDDLPGRFFTWWDPGHLRAVVEAAGFGIDDLHVTEPSADGHARIELVATALRALPDHVGARMRLLCCGLNPSLHAADAGVGYVTGNNRFWPALEAAGLLTGPQRDNRRLLWHDHIGMTDLVKRATARADELTRDEYRVGVDRLAALCAWLRPAAVAVNGLAGWRAAVDRKAAIGWQPEPLGDAPVYVFPSTSGLNARVPLAELVEHLRAAADGPDHGARA